MKELILETRDICKSYGKQSVLRHVSMAVPKQCVYGLLGANGVGKSTLMKILVGISRADAGEVVFEGSPWNREALARIGTLIERPPLYENLSARENLKVKTLLLGIPEQRIDEVLEIVGLTETGRKKAGQFSMGMKQRLGIAMALLGNPGLLILDEPANGLDPLGIQDLRGLLRSFAAQGMTVIVSSHILSEIEQTADYVGILSDGVLGYQGAVGNHLEELFMRVVKENRRRN